MPKNIKQIILAVTLALIAIAVIRNIVEISQDPFPELKNMKEETDIRNQKLKEALEKANQKH